MRKLFVDCALLAALALVFALALGVAGANPNEEYHTSITFKGAIKTVVSVPAKVNGKTVDINIVNGFVPDQILEGQSNGKITIHTFIFRNNTPYQEGKKYEYVFEQKGFTVSESRQKLGTDGKPEGPEQRLNEHTSVIYKLK